VYLWAGVRDDHVPLSSVSQFAGELARRSNPVTMLIDPDAGHSAESRRGSEAYLYLLEAATHRHFGGAITPMSASLQHFLKQNTRLGFDLIGGIQNTEH
jgi:hypothetical protein